MINFSEGLVLGGGGNLAFGSKVGDKSLYPLTGSGQRFFRAHVFWVAFDFDRLSPGLWKRM